MSKQQKTVQLEEIKREIQKLREQTNTTNAQIVKFVETRNQMNEQVKNTHQEINDLKAQRDSINEQVKQLKAQRDQIRDKAKPITEEINSVREKIAELKKNLPRESQKSLQEEHDAIEWKIQTTSLDLQEEKGLIENVKKLEILMSNYKKINARNKIIKELYSQRKVIDQESDVLHNQLTELAKKSQELHLQMVEKINSARVSRAQADSQHQAYIKAKEELTTLYVKIAELTGQLNGVRNSLFEEDRESRAANQQASKEQELASKEKEKANKEKQQAIKEKLEAEAKEKLQRGEKISWNEFQLAIGESDENDSEGQD
jgi:uncharacterized coiled-coil DUF342 family protein